ncbi:MAG TPA: MlaD family protein [Solirubrobacteraceae bacterium]|nr:MlaD family protein [Solirubrobacteraceae bacterium]
MAFRAADADGHAAAATAVGLIAESRGDRAEAHEAYQRAFDRGDPMGGVRLGLQLSAANRWDEAEAIWDQAARLPARSEDPEIKLETILRGPAAPPPPAPLPSTALRSPFMSPVLIGAVTVAALLIGVFLAYNSNKGLPFVPTRELKVDIGDGSDLVVGNDVREGGFLVGLVSGTRAVTVNGTTIAQLTLKLQGAQEKVPIDSRVAIDSKSLLGLKYVEIARGRSRRYFANGGTVPVGQTNVPVQLDDVFDTFTPPTRRAIQHALVGVGDVLAGRGGDLNDTIHSLPALFGNLEPVAAYLSAPSTELIRFIDQLNGFVGTVAPFSATFSQLFTDQATTFGAISRYPTDLERTIARSPSTLSVSTASLRAQQPLLTDFASLGRALQPATASLRSALPQINPAIEQGARVLGRTPPLDARLQRVLASLKNLANAPGTNLALNGLTATTTELDPLIKYLGPYVTVCDYWDYWWNDLAGDLDEETTFGYAQRVSLNLANLAQTNNLGTQGASEPVNGGGGNSLLGGNEYLHDPSYGAAIDNAGNADCELGQRGYPLKLNHSDPQGRDFDTDPHTPGDQGSTFKGQSHVPKGETFSRNPLFGPQLANNPSNP